MRALGPPEDGIYPTLSSQSFPLWEHRGGAGFFPHLGEVESGHKGFGDGRLLSLTSWIQRFRAIRTVYFPIWERSGREILAIRVFEAAVCW